MKPFDLAKAKAGEKLITRDGRSVSEFHHFETDSSPLNCCFIVGGGSYWVREDGLHSADSSAHPIDLFMAPKKRTVYVQIFNKATDTEEPCLRAVAFEVKDDAENNVRATAWPVLVVAHPVEIEE
ncbi:MAG: hypothetical protein VB138_15335 [Burkholderia sp.]